MGCGKTSVGRRLAGLTGHRYVDTDEQVIQAEGLSITEIFAAKGEAGFREAEEKALAGLVGVSGIVLSTGGGVILKPDNRILLKKIGTVAWLDANPDLLFERASRSGKRPLLHTDNPRGTFDALLASRRELYGEASDFRLDVTALSLDEAAQSLLDHALRQRRFFEG